MKEKKIAVITEADHGLGLNILKLLLQKGIKVIFTSQDSKKGEEVCKELQGEQWDVVYHHLNFTDIQSLLAFKIYIKKEFKRLDILINNINVFLLAHPSQELERNGILETDSDLVEQSFQANTLGPYQLMQNFLPLMIEQNYGRIVNISSPLASFSHAAPGFPAYRISKAALHALTFIAAQEFTKLNIKINSAWTIQEEKQVLGETHSDNLGEVETIVWLATLPDDGPTGGLFKNFQKVERVE